MCGITGFWWPRKVDANLAEQMANQITSRGPDDFGTWCSAGTGLALSHRRLSIIDLSPAGHQPMLSSCGRYTLVFNGEIYNHLNLRHELENAGCEFAWRGHSDTETLLAGMSVWGVQGTLGRLNGMFAFALWDSAEKALFLARDRMGEKPLYWGWCDKVLLFGSELKALKAHPSFNAEIDRNALTLLLRHCYIPAPYSIYQGIQKLMPGHFVQIPLQGDVARSKDAQPEAYWQINQAVEQGLANPFTGSPDEAVDLLESQLSASIGEQMLSDVPLGAFLSGGVDSSTIVALMQAQSERPVQTFTIGFDQVGYNEATHAKSVAEHLGTHHTELYVRPEDALAVIPKLPHMYCEPFADSSQISTFLVSQMAKQHVTVALSGDGGDELFGGYNRYMAVQKIWQPLQKMPDFARVLAVGGLNSLSPAGWD